MKRCKNCKWWYLSRPDGSFGGCDMLTNAKHKDMLQTMKLDEDSIWFDKLTDIYIETADNFGCVLFEQRED